VAIHGHIAANEPDAGAPKPGATTVSAEEDARGPDRLSGWRHAVAELLYAPWPALLRILAFGQFRRLAVRHCERFPAHGPVLLIANHPAAWTDVLVLHVALGRRLHFLTSAWLFRPRPRAWLLRVFGALPVMARSAGTATDANAATFRRCQQLLAHGRVVGVFAEGVSAGDRSLEPFHRGAAEIARARLASGHGLTIVPVGLHYGDRMAFRGEVVVRIGRPIRASYDGTGAAWVAALTARLRERVASLIVTVPDPDRRWLVEELASLCHPARHDDPGRFERSRRVLRRLARLRRVAPVRLSRLESIARRERALRLEVGADAAALDGAVRVSAARSVAVALGAPLALCGLLAHAVPAAVASRVARRYSAPPHVGFARLAAGAATTVLWYGLLAVVSVIAGGPTLERMAIVAALGVFALGWLDAWHDGLAAHRVARLERRDPALVDRLRRLRGRLRFLLDAPAARRARAERAAEGAR
jgi:1-acyl-sn-glycerol-3-phosphate acyltransferase